MNRSAIVAANVLKFGLPLAVLVTIGRLASIYFWAEQSISSDHIFDILGIFLFCLFWGVVLGLITAGRRPSVNASPEK